MALEGNAFLIWAQPATFYKGWRSDKCTVRWDHGHGDTAMSLVGIGASNAKLLFGWDDARLLWPSPMLFGMTLK